MKLKDLLIIGLVGAILLVLTISPQRGKLGEAGGRYINTFTSGVTHATTSISTASTNVATSVTNWLRIDNSNTTQLTCVLETTGTTAASSSVVAGRGILVGPHGVTTSSLPSTVTFGECWPGTANCVPFKGSINCVAGTTSTVSVTKR